MSDRNGDFGAFFSGLLMGGIIGAVSALLMAPQSGEETRKLLRERGIELRDMSSDALEKAAAEARERADELTRLAREQAKDLRGRAEDVRTRGEAAIEDIRLRGEAAVEAAKTPRGGKKN
ncbi:MAG: YtxH domain-containing protein [Anaerolineales bacterium]|nr:YtxH domain-containing protein [Anaerolineales bacterium]MCW5856239.1 YtxH domain-containing protein [Anaerolineales bacterium]